MLAIKRERFYKNRIFLSGMAVVAGFLFTVGLIRTVTPVDNSTNQSAQSGSDRRAASLIPINASDSESSSESGKDSGSGSALGSNDQTPANKSGSSWIAPTPSASTASSQNNNQTNSPTPTPSSSPSAEPASGTPTVTTPGGGSGSGGDGEGGILDPITCGVLDLTCN